MNIRKGWVDRQVPAGDEVFLDHVGYFSADLSAAGTQLERLGFRVSPVNVQYNANEDGDLVLSGTSNRLVWLERGFLEVLAATSETALAEQLQAALRRYRGFHVVAMTHADMAEQRARLVDIGFAMQEIVNLRRRIDTPDGEKRVAYSVLRCQPGVMGEGRIQMMTHHTPELLWTPEATSHPNHAVALTDLMICVADPEEAADRFSRYTGCAIAEAGPVRWVVLDRGRIGIADADTLRERMSVNFDPPALPFIAGQALRSRNIPETLRVLSDAGIVPDYSSERFVCVAPEDALGGYMLFHAVSVDDPWSAFARERQA